MMPVILRINIKMYPNEKSMNLYKKYHSGVYF